MAIDDAAEKLAQESLLTGGLTKPLTGQEPYYNNTDQLNLDLLPGSEYDIIKPQIVPSYNDIKVAGLSDSIRRGLFGKVLTDASKKAKILEAERALRIGNEPVTFADDAAATNNIPGQIKPDRTGVNIRPTVEDAAKVAQDIKKPLEVSESGLLTDFRAVGSKGDVKIPDEGNILSTIETISTKYKNQITDATRGNITAKATEDLADLVGANPRKLANLILGRQKGSVIVDSERGFGLAETMLAARELLVKEIKILDGLANKAEDGTDADALAFRAQLELVGQLQAQIKGSQTEIARALAQFRIPVRSGDADMSRPDLTSLLEDYGGSDDIRNMAKLYNQGAADGDNIRKADLARKFSGTRKTFDAVYEAWINILLSSPVTHSKNIIGAFLTTFAHVPETFAGATAGAIRRSLGGEGGMTFGEAKAVMFATIMSIKDAWSAAGKGFATGEKVMSGSKIEPEKGRRNVKAFSAEGMDLQGNMGTAVDILGRFMTLDRVPTKALEFEDAFFKGIAYKQSLYQDAYRTGTQNGKTGDALSEYIAEYITNPPKNAIIKGEAHAKYVTLQSDLDEVGKNLSKTRKVPGIRYFIPFFKTPYNATKYALLDRTPLGIYAGDARRAIEKGSAPGATSSDRAAADLAKGRIALGSTTTALIAYFASQGYITGGGPTDRDFAKTKKRMGWKPYSFRVPDGEGGYQYVSYQFSEPFASIVGIAADLGESGLNGDIDFEDWMTIVNKVSLVLSNQITDKTFMSGFASLIETISDPTRFTKQTVENFIRSFTPRIVAQAEKVIDPVAREGRTLMDNFRQQIPGLSSTLEARRNVWGIPIIVDDALGPDIVSPIYRSFYGVNKQAPDQNYAKRAFAMDEIFNSIKYGPSRHPETFPQLGGNKTQKLALTNQELALYHELAGKNFLEQSERFFEQSNVQDFLRVARKGNKDAQKILDSKLTLLLSASRQKAAMDIINNSKFSDSIRDRLDRVNDEYVKELEDLEKELNE
jgi:hypothetical protein